MNNRDNIMNIVCCVKQVPDTTEVKIDPVTNTLQRAGVPSILNPYDVHGVEEAVRLKEKYGGKVTVICMGPPQAAEDLKSTISLGADRVILVSDRAFAGADTLATSYVLATAIGMIAKEERVDLVFTGKQAIDGDTAQVGPGIAQRLGMEQLTYVHKVHEVDQSRHVIRVSRHLEEGEEVIESKLPVLLTVIKELNEVRRASLPGMIHAARYEVEVWGKAALPTEDQYLGLAGSPTKVSKVFPPPTRSGGEILQGDPATICNQLIEKLQEKKLFEKLQLA